VPQANALIANLNTLNGVVRPSLAWLTKRDYVLLVALATLARTDSSITRPPCVACYGFDQLCVAPERGSCAWCLGHRYECLFRDSVQDGAPELLDAVIARAREEMYAEAAAYVEPHVLTLIPRIPALVKEICPVPVQPDIVRDWGRAFLPRLRADLLSEVKGALPRHEAEYRATHGPYALGIVRELMQGGAKCVEDLPRVLQTIEKAFRDMREDETPAFQAYVEDLARGQVEQEVAADDLVPTTGGGAGEEASAEVGRDALQQAFSRLPELKLAVAAQVLAESPNRNIFDRYNERQELPKELDQWEEETRKDLGGRVFLLRPGDVAAWVPVAEARMRENAVECARHAIAELRKKAAAAREAKAKEVKEEVDSL
jgi:hypothetical protein